MLHNIDEQRQIAAVRPKSFLINSVRNVFARENHFCSFEHYPNRGGAVQIVLETFGAANFPQNQST